MPKHFNLNYSVDGNEGMLYDQFVKLYGTREKTNDVTNPRYTPVGDIILPRDSLIHFQQQTPGEVGPSNTAPFISNYDSRVNIYFNVNYEVVLGTTKIQNLQLSSIIKGYESSHFLYSRTRNYQSVITKKGELLVNDLAIGQVPVLYKRRTVFTPYQISYNNFCTLFDSVNEFAKFGKHQFIEIPLPRTFPTFKTLELNFNKYKKFFNDDYEVVRYDKIPLQPFQAEHSFWLLDLYGILMGYDNAKYSLFSRLSEPGRKQLEIIFTYNGKCWIVNLQNLINLLNYSDKPKDTSPSALKINYFKRFYLGLINLVTPISEAVEIIEGVAETSEEDNDGGKDRGREKQSNEDDEETEVVSKPNTFVGNNTGHGALADLYASGKGSNPVPDDTLRDQGKETNSQAPELQPEQDDTEDDVSIDSWGQDVPDELFERATVETASISVSQAASPTSTIERQLAELARTGQLTSKEQEYFERAANTYKEIQIGSHTLEEIVDITPADMVLRNTDISPDSLVVTDKTALKSTTDLLGKDYIARLLHRNIIEMVLHVQNGGTALTGLDVERTITADSKYDVYTMKFQRIKGGQSTRRMRLPVVEEDGTFTINGVKSYAQLMRMELPIRKISPTKVALTSYYDKKVMVERSTKKVDDYAHWLKTNIIERGYQDKSIVVSLGGYKPPKDEVCYYYSILAGRFKSIITPEYNFDFDTVKLVNGDKALAKLCNANSWVIGFKEEHPILIDGNGLVIIDGKEIGYIEEILGLNIARAPIPTATVNINGYHFPAVVVLSYWIGFSQLLKLLKADFRVVDPDQRPQLGSDEYMVTFADERLVFNRRDELTTLIMSGLRKLNNLSNFSRSHLDDPNVWFGLVGDQRVKPSHFKEMTMLYDMFIDPITMRLLKKFKYPVIMDKLVIEAVKLMLSNESKHEIEITEQRFVGYERFAGHVYREFVKSTRQARNKPNNGKVTFDLNPEAIMMNIITDSSAQASEEVNPVHQVKQQEEVTFGGTLGRSDQAMVRRTRGQLPNYEGIISEAGKDSGKVGFISYLTSDAKIVDLYGNVDVSKKTTNTGRGSVAMNLLYGMTKDDTKRLNIIIDIMMRPIHLEMDECVNP